MSASGQVRWFDSADKWPQHAKPWFRDALAQARAAGWLFKGAGGAAHIFGTVYCRPAPAESRCRFVVFSTGTGGESAASELVRMIGQCTHLSDDQQSVLQRATVQLTKLEALLRAAGRLLDAAASQVDAANAWTTAGELLAEAEPILAEVTESIERAEAMETAAARARTEAVTALRPLHLDHAGPAEVLDHADQVTTAVGTDLADLPPAAPEVADAAGRLAAAQAHLDALRGRSANM